MTEVKPPSASPGTASDRHVAALLGDVFERIRRDLARHERGGLRPSHYRLLEAVPASGITSTELAPVLRMTKQAVGQFVTHLAETGYVEVRADSTDRRRRLVFRTERGDRTVDGLRTQLEELEREWSATVGPERYREFRSVLESLSAGEGAAGP